ELDQNDFAAQVAHGCLLAVERGERDIGGCLGRASKLPEAQPGQGNHGDQADDDFLHCTGKACAPSSTVVPGTAMDAPALEPPCGAAVEASGSIRLSGEMISNN